MSGCGDWGRCGVATTRMTGGDGSGGGCGGGGGGRCCS